LEIGADGAVGDEFPLPVAVPVAPPTGSNTAAVSALEDQENSRNMKRHNQPIRNRL
jgi:hypothetical protein